MTKYSMDKWDLDIRPVLAAIDIDAGWIRHYAKQIHERALALTERPDFTTMAEDSLSKAIKELEACAAALKIAQEHYNKKPVMEK